MPHNEWDATWERWMNTDFKPTNGSVMELMAEAYLDGMSAHQTKVKAFLVDMIPHAPEHHKEVFIGILDALEELEETKE